MFVVSVLIIWGFFFQAEDGIRDLVRSRGLGDVYKRQGLLFTEACRGEGGFLVNKDGYRYLQDYGLGPAEPCLLYTSDAADERSSVDLGGRRIIKKKKKQQRSKGYRR